MEVGMIQVIQSWGFEGMSDAQVYEEELKLAINAEELGFDHIWVVEHHFTDYSFCPDNFVYLAYLAAQTERIGLATGAVIVPWNIQPLRVAEKAALLDQLSGGRLILGLGRGLSRREFEQFGMGGLLTSGTEVVRGPYQARTKQPVPEPVSQNPRGKRISIRGNPLTEFPTTTLFFRNRKLAIKVGHLQDSS